MAAVKVSVTGDTMLDIAVAVGKACVLVLVSRGNSREVDVEDRPPEIAPFPETNV